MFLNNNPVFFIMVCITYSNRLPNGFCFSFLLNYLNIINLWSILNGNACIHHNMDCIPVDLLSTAKFNSFSNKTIPYFIWLKMSALEKISSDFYVEIKSFSFSIELLLCNYWKKKSIIIFFKIDFQCWWFEWSISSVTYYVYDKFLTKMYEKLVQSSYKEPYFDLFFTIFSCHSIVVLQKVVCDKYYQLLLADSAVYRMHY